MGVAHKYKVPDIFRFSPMQELFRLSNHAARQSGSNESGRAVGTPGTVRRHESGGTVL